VSRLPPEQPSDDSALVVPSARNELHALHVESLSPPRLVFENRFRIASASAARPEELDDLMDLVGDDRVENHRRTINVRDLLEEP
jgi:hypothetical protein